MNLLIIFPKQSLFFKPLANLMPLASFYTPWKHKKIKEHPHEMGYNSMLPSCRTKPNDLILKELTLLRQVQVQNEKILPT